ncbi:PREDICTED: putative uncharacterized protein DDB_G0279653 [Polistes dominula]|uniref:Uncharacterized protein n=1 Tax=Polistes dominula TaxID=743375 RepID=A0ABM1HXG2_POLDO|nr:PREDICTED: putative uncharacterized protein DDB_G0279653 [Polistes dominula]
MSEVKTERPRTAGRIAPTGRVTPSVHQSAGGGRRKAIPVPPPRVPTPMPSANNNQQRNNANFDVGPPVVVPPPPSQSQSQKKESHENIARIAKRYLDDNMQQAWINPRLISMINVEAVTSTDYDSSNLSRDFNQVGFNTYNYSQFEEKYKPRQIFKYGDEYLEYGRNSVRLDSNAERSTARLTGRYQQDGLTKFEQRYSRSHSQPERQQYAYHETRSKSQDSRELTFYHIDPPPKLENPQQQQQQQLQQSLQQQQQTQQQQQQPQQYQQQQSKSYRSSTDKSATGNKKELTFYKIDGPSSNAISAQDKGKDKCDKKDRNQDKFVSSKHAKQNHQEQKSNSSIPPNYQLNRSQSDLSECQLPDYYRHQNNPYIDPPKYRQYDRPPKYQETPPKSEPPPKYHAEPPKYSEIVRRQDDSKRTQRSQQKTCDVLRCPNNNNNNNNNNCNREDIYCDSSDDSELHQQQQIRSGCSVILNSSVPCAGGCCSSSNTSNSNNGVCIGVISNNGFGSGASPCCELTSISDKYKSAVESLLKANETVQGRPVDRSMLKIEKPQSKVVALHGVEVTAKSTDRMKSSQDVVGYVSKHDSAKSKANHDSNHGFKVENLKYYGELKGYDFKSYGTIDKPIVTSHEKSHLHGAPEKVSHEKCHAKLSSGSTSSSSPAIQAYLKVPNVVDRQTEKSPYGEHYYHRSSHSKPQNAYQVYQETKYSYNVSGVPGTPAQASAAAAFFARLLFMSGYLVCAGARISLSTLDSLNVMVVANTYIL